MAKPNDFWQAYIAREVFDILMSTKIQVKQSCLSELGQNGRQAPSHHFGTTLEGKIIFNLNLLRHKNIKTSPCKLSKNDFVLPSLLFFKPVREKIKVTVSLDHPVTFNQHCNLYHCHCQEDHHCHIISLKKYLSVIFIIMIIILIIKKLKTHDHHIAYSPL